MTHLTQFGIRKVYILLCLLITLSSCNLIKGMKEKKEIKATYSKNFENDQKYRLMVMYGTTSQTKIDSLNKLDMKVRVEIFRKVLKDENGIYKNLKDSLWTLQSDLDSLNYVNLMPLLKKNNMPTYIDKFALLAVFSHIPHVFENEMSDILNFEFKKGNLTSFEYAQIIDKIEIVNKRPQKYYSIKTFGKKIELDIKDCEKINNNRKSIGLVELKCK